MRTTTLVALGLGLGLAAGCGNVSNDKPKDASADPDAPAIDAPIDAPVLPACASPKTGTAISFRPIGDVGTGALLATAPPGDDRLFVVVQGGQIRIFKDEQLTPTPFIDLASVLASGGERGLLGLAFHPQYASNGLFFVYYTTTTQNIVARCSVSANRDVANPTCTPILTIPDFASNHNGGMIEFGSDGYLYIGTGDGGNGGDPNQNGQSIMDGSPSAASVALLAKILRLDVDTKATGKEYGIPPTNPFAGGGGAPEIFMIGLRNPWRWSFDRATGDMWIADVGQNLIEELDYVKAADLNGGAGTPVNFGWRIYEGDQTYNGAPPAPAGKTMPVFVRTHAQGWASITGGQVYRGSCYPDIVGHYFFGDYAGSHYARATVSGSAVTVEDLPGALPTNPASLHADARGELYLTSTDGRVLRLEAGP